MTDLQKLQSVFLTSDSVAYCCDATYYKGTSPGDIGKCRRTHIVEEVTGGDELNREISVIGSLGTIGTTSEHNNRVHDPEGISPTATAVAGSTHHIKIFDYSRYRVRKLTPTEYGRLQGFPMDSWVLAVSNSQAYKQFGNAVTTTVAKGIATNIIAFLDSALGGGELGS